ncbi:MAG: hypothetical protein ACP5N1_05790 [Candidatus Woesearchaeota archaeon]
MNEIIEVNTPQLSTIQNISGNLLDTINNVDIYTIQHSREIQKERLTNSILRNMLFWTGDYPLYAIENGEAILYIANRDNNLIFKNIEKAYNQLKKTGHFVPEPQDIALVINDANTQRVNLSNLELKKHTIAEWSYFEIYTANSATANNNEDKKNNYDILNIDQRLCAETIHGYNLDFTNGMAMLFKSGIKTTRVYTLTPEYVKETLDKNNITAFSRAAFLYNFGNFSSFGADYKSVEHISRCVRAEPLNHTLKQNL